MTLRITIVVTLWIVIAIVIYAVLNGLRRRKDALLRLQRDTAAADDPSPNKLRFSWLRRHMMLAGFARPAA